MRTTWDGNASAPTIERMRLVFAVSDDEEHVELKIAMPSDTLDLGARAHHYLLLTLARARLADRDGSGESVAGKQGWLYQEDLARMLDMDEQHVNVNVYRARRQLAHAGVGDAAAVIERRPGTRRLRLGVADIEITRI